ncbi:MAG: choice-of-anchor J domain-containing protein, partial [Gammaproteobacteria bacterium]|nr:choice-of-anchor J domain-containing protein [Gammaproteobacteria bacterium]
MDDNPVGGNQITSIEVTPGSTAPSAPEVLISPIAEQEIESGSSITFAWRDPGGGMQFQVSLDGPPGESTSSEWMNSPYWIIGEQLPEGSYTWKVLARSCPDESCNSPWSNPSSFTIISPASTSLLATTPFIDNFESGIDNWNKSGLWNLQSDDEFAHSLDHSWYYGIVPSHNYDDGGPNFGDLTTRPITIPDDNYVLRFWYRYDTEGPGVNWDQRWIQISSGGGSFENVLQLYDDEPNQWLHATLDLSAYAGQSIQVRFHFASLDDQKNDDFEGWLIDDIEIIQDSLPPCADADNTIAGASTINFGQTVSKEICPTGDVDYFKFNGLAGDHIVLDVDTPTNNPVEDLDLYLFLIDSDGESSIAQHDDEILGIKLDPHLGYHLTRSGTYFVRARLWSHPSHGGEEFTYNLTLNKDNTAPQGIFISPTTASYLQDSQDLTLSVNASDLESGISHVDFLYHPGDWITSTWQIIGTDQDGSDGWQITFDTTVLSEQKNMAFFANIYNWTGNWMGAGSWELVLDLTPPVTALDSLEPIQQSTAFQLQWTGSDNLSGIEY